MLSKRLKAKRMAKGALTLASSEIRFNIDSETMDPISVQEKKPLDTNSMVGCLRGERKGLGKLLEVCDAKLMATVDSVSVQMV